MRPLESSSPGATAAAATAEAPELTPLHWPVADLLAAFRDRTLSPVEVAREALERIEAADPQLNAFLAITADLALEQAAAAEESYRRGDVEGELLGVPISIKDAFHIAGHPTTVGSLIHRDEVAAADSGVVRRLRAAGAVFVGKTNTAEFGQSATTENRLRDAARNPWNPQCTPGGSSGGAAASVAAGLASLAVGSDGGGSVRIPAAFCGLFGIKPTQGLCRDEGGVRAMSDFVSPGPLAWRVADARAMLSVLAGRDYRQQERGRMRIAWCARPEGHPVDPGLAGAVASGAGALERLGHEVTPVDLPLGGWERAFGPLVLDEERRERGHLLEARGDELSSYELSSLREAERLTAADVDAARDELGAYRDRIDGFFASHDLICTPTVAVPAFEVGRRPREIAGERVGALWGAFPFTAPFNVARVTAATLPCGLVDGMPAGLQLVAPAGGEGLLLDVCEQLEAELDFDRSPVLDRWREPNAPRGGERP